MRDRLIEVLREPTPEIKGYNDIGVTRMSIVDAEKAADRILSDGWIRPPCQEKDEFFILEKTQDGTQVTKLIVRFVSIYKNRFEIYCDTEARDGGYHFEPCRIGEDIYYTEEEAEQALKGGA